MTQTITRETVYERLANLARPLIRQYYTVDSCIASTWLVIRTLEVFGIRAEPAAVSLLAFNREWATLLEAEGWPDEARSSEWQRTAGAWSVGVGLALPHEVVADKWNGHLVALTNDRMLIDASADQASRPERGIVLPGVVVARHTRGFKSGEMRVIVPLEADAFAFYDPRRNVPLPITAPDWIHRERLTPLVLELVELIRGTRKPSTHLADGIIRP